MLSIYNIPNKLPNEKIIKVVRRDIFILLSKIAMMILLFILPIFLFFVIQIVSSEIVNNFLFYVISVLTVSFYYLFMWVFFFFSFIDYYLDVWIITNQRIIDIEQKGFFSRVISEHKLFRIQDVTSEIHGVVPTFLNYGVVEVQTAGTKQRFTFNQVPDPDGIRNIVIELVERNKRKNK